MLGQLDVTQVRCAAKTLPVLERRQALIASASAWLASLLIEGCRRRCCRDRAERRINGTRELALWRGPSSRVAELSYRSSSVEDPICLKLCLV